MNTIRITLLSSLVLAFAATAAGAAPQAEKQLANGTVLFQSDTGLPIVMNPGSARQGESRQHHVRPPRGADAEDNVANNPLAPFISWAGYSLPESGFAYQFTSAFTKNVKEINIALAAIDAQDYGYSAEVDLFTDNNGVPGTKIDGSHITAGETSFGPCCALTTVKLGFKPALYAGKPYWVVVTPDPNTYLAWQFESTDFIDVGTISSNDGSGWKNTTSQWYVPAVEVK